MPMQTRENDSLSQIRKRKHVPQRLPVSRLQMQKLQSSECQRLYDATMKSNCHNEHQFDFIADVTIFD